MSLIQRELRRERREANNPSIADIFQTDRSEGNFEIFELLRRFLLFYLRNNQRPQWSGVHLWRTRPFVEFLQTREAERSLLLPLLD